MQFPFGTTFSDSLTLRFVRLAASAVQPVFFQMAVHRHAADAELFGQSRNIAPVRQQRGLQAVSAVQNRFFRRFGFRSGGGCFVGKRTGGGFEIVRQVVVFDTRMAGSDQGDFQYAGELAQVTPASGRRAVRPRRGQTGL